MRLKAAGILLAGLLLALQAVAGIAGATAPSESGTMTVTFRIVPRIELDLSTDAINFGNLEPGTRDFENLLTTTVRSNTPWSLTASAPSFSDGGVPALTIPITRLSTRPGAADYMAMVNLPGQVTLLSGQPRGGNLEHVWDYRLAIEWTDVPATYTTTITYTATGS
ncbi:MAG TPA: hypothetical protein VLK32_03345 [Bacillota bacterium]|nr:hypothetical protein [Bacillota bacterium]